MIRAWRRRALAVVVTGTLLVAGARVGSAADDQRTIPSRPGVTQSFLLVRPAGPPTAAVVLFAGGNGALKLGTGRLGLAATSSSATAPASPSTGCWSRSSTPPRTGRTGSTASAPPPPTPRTCER